MKITSETRGQLAAEQIISSDSELLTLRAEQVRTLRAELARIRAMALKHLVAGDEVNATTEALVSQLCSLADDEALSRDVVTAAAALRRDKAPACASGPGCCRFCALLHAVDEFLEEKGGPT